MINIQNAKKNDMDWVNNHYKEIGFKESDFSNEIIVLAECYSVYAGVGRLQKLDQNSVELGGIFVLPEFRAKGIAKEIVKSLVELGQTFDSIYCLLFAHLENFYKQFGFEEILIPKNVPKTVLDKQRWCNKTYEHETLLFLISN